MYQRHWHSTLLIYAVGLGVVNVVAIGVKLFYVLWYAHPAPGQSPSIALLLALLNAWLMSLAAYVLYLYVRHRVYAIAVNGSFIGILSLFSVIECAVLLTPDVVAQLKTVWPVIATDAALLLVNAWFGAYLHYSPDVRALEASTASVNYFGLIRSFVHLFNVELYGVNFYMVFVFFGAALLLVLGQSALAGEPPSALELNMHISVLILKGVFFLFLMHLSRHNWYLPCLWGACNALLENLYLYGLGASSLFLWQPTAVYFIAGFIFMLFLVGAIRLFGVRFEVMALVGAAAHACAYAVNYYWLHLYAPVGFDWHEFALSVFEGLLLGGAIYISTYLYFQRWQGSTWRGSVRSNPANSES